MTMKKKKKVLRDSIHTTTSSRMGSLTVAAKYETHERCFNHSK